MSIFFNFLFVIVISPFLLLLNGCNSEDAFSDESTVKLERIDITASPITTRGVSELTLAIGNEQLFEAVGHYSDGSSHTLTDLNVSNWHTSNSDAGYFDKSGIFTANNKGYTTLTATKDGVTSNAVGVDVSDAIITAIQVMPSPRSKVFNGVVNLAKGQTQRLVATATYSDGTSSDVTDSVAWTPVDTATATVSPAGLFSAVTVGHTTLTATKDGVISNAVGVDVSDAVITAIQVTPSPVNVAKGQTQQLVATATYSDGTSFDVTDSVTWKAVDTATATVSPAGLFSAVTVGHTTLTATKDGVISNAVGGDVSDAVITAIQVTPSPVNVAKGQTQRLVAMAAYSDGTSSDVTDSVTWKAVDTATATVSPAGLFSAVKVGNTTLTATKDRVISKAVGVDVSDAVITAIQVTPSPVNVAKGQTQRLVATAIYSDGTSSDVTDSVTWTAVDTATATVSPAGLFSAFTVGNTTLTANKNGVTSDAVDVDVCSNLAGPCIDIFDIGNGKLFTNSPSAAYLDHIGVSAIGETFYESGEYGSASEFYIYTWNHAKSLCDAYNINSIGGRTNWRLATSDELKEELFNAYGNMFAERGWPISDFYWSVTPGDSKYYVVDLFNGYVNRSYPGLMRYASCVSNP
ncbi:Ig-like domain-containing protein [Photobacterium angustum]|uniref:Ig-like domain-containing protein n=1 Tax=Photobacterium angustum TaxID=661 RepID=UPI003D0C8046